jgi:hypothetical protein
MYASHSWGSAGGYSVTVRAQSDSGAWSSSWSSPLTIHIGQVTLQVYAYNQYNEEGYVPVWMYTGSTWENVGTTPYTCQLTPGNYQICMEDPLFDGYFFHYFEYYYYDGNYYYDNPTTLSVTSDKTVTAYYYSWW